MSTVFGGLGPGLGQTINPFDPNYQDQLRRAANQAEADRENAAAAAVYKKAAADMLTQNVQLSAAGKSLLSLSPPPHKKVLDQNGNVVDSTDLVTDIISVVPIQGLASAGGVPIAAVPVPDRTDRVIAMLMVLKQDLEAIKAKLGV